MAFGPFRRLVARLSCRPPNMPFDAMRLITLALLSLLPLACLAQDHGRDPEAARLVTEDLPRFWAAWDAASRVEGAAARAQVFDALYLDEASPGLEAFTRLRIEDAGQLVAEIDKHPAYYASLRDRMPALEARKPEIRATLRRMAEVYPDAVFPDVYFVMGRMNSAGTLDSSGLLIGVDMFGRGEGAPLHELGPWHQAVVGEFDALPGIVAHEWVHFQQRSRIDGRPTLLQAAIGEGVADFIAELGAGRHLNHDVHAWAEPRAAELWVEFARAKDGTDYAGWLYEGDSARPGRPADLGYWMGYRIAKGYYDRVEDKAAAIREMLHIDDFDAFLAASGIADELG